MNCVSTFPFLLLVPIVLAFFGSISHHLNYTYYNLYDFPVPFPMLSATKLHSPTYMLDNLAPKTMSDTQWVHNDIPEYFM